MQKLMIIPCRDPPRAILGGLYIFAPWWRFRNMANFGKEVNFVHIKNAAIKNVQTDKDAKCSPEFKSFGILILSITVDP